MFPLFLINIEIYRNVIHIEPSIKQIEAVEQKFCQFVYMHLDQIRLFSGVSKIKSLCKQLPIYIVSATPSSEVEIVVDNNSISHVFSGVYGGPTSKIDHLQTILNINNNIANELIFVGDAYKDYEAGMEVGVQFCGIVSHKNASPFPNDVRCYSNLDLFFENEMSTFL